jgi:hypothetical protein
MSFGQGSFLHINQKPGQSDTGTTVYHITECGAIADRFPQGALADYSEKTGGKVIEIILVAALLVGLSACAPHPPQRRMLAITMLYHHHRLQDIRLRDIPPLIPHPRGITGVRGIPTIS